VAHIQLDRCVSQALGNAESADQAAWKSFDDLVATLHGEARVRKLEDIDRRRENLQRQDASVRASLVELASERAAVMQKHPAGR
jgi:hypothetical protein